MTKAGTKSLLSAVLVMLAVGGDRGEAQPYPSSPVKVISDSAPGSAPDAILRIVAERLSDAWGQQGVVMNQPGAGGALAARAGRGAARAGRGGCRGPAPRSRCGARRHHAVHAGFFRVRDDEGRGPQHSHRRAEG